MRYVSVPEMIAIEKEADASGHTYEKMMEHAGRGLAEVVDLRYEFLREEGVLALIGSGNNGGDALVAMDYLSSWGWNCTAYLVKERSDDDPLITRFLDSGGELYEFNHDKHFENLNDLVAGCGIVLDGVLGTGIKLPLRGKIPGVLEHVRALLDSLAVRPAVIAVDCPSGIDCDSGKAAPECIPADVTVTMAAVKRGLLSFPAYNLVGELEAVGIGLPSDLEVFERINRHVVDETVVRRLMPARPLNSHKGTFGTALVAAGSRNYTGAALLAGEAAYRSGAGLVTLAVPQELHPMLAGQLVEATWLPLPDVDGAIAEAGADTLGANLGRVTALLVGPGFGLHESTRRFLDALLPPGKNNGKQAENDLPPMVLDADGLKLVSRLPAWATRLPPESILTPHPGEMSVITSMSTEDIQADRVGVAERFAAQWGHVVVLKGAFTVIAAPDGETGVIPIATPALARAGTGDVLAGLITGLLAQGMHPFEAGLSGAWIHAQAGRHAASVLGSTASVLAGDVLQACVDVIAGLYV